MVRRGRADAGADGDAQGWRIDGKALACAEGRGKVAEGEGGMTISISQLEEARRALDAPLFADVAGDAAISFEFFPPKSEKMEETLWEAVKTLEPLAPR